MISCIFMCMNRDENFEEVNLMVIANELDRLMDRYKTKLDFSDRLAAAEILRKGYGAKLRAVDNVFSNIIPKYEEMLADPEVVSLAKRFIEFGDRYNKGEEKKGEFDLYSFQGASLNELHALVRNIVKEVLREGL